MTAAVLVLVAVCGTALAAFSTSTGTASNQVTALTIPVPQNFACAGILNLLNPRLVWDPVTVTGATVSYRVTDPNGVVTNTSATQYQLKNTTPLLTGTYHLRAQVTAWNWTSQETTKAVTANVLGLLYVCL
ncbi:MAG: hypothetical protein J0H98_05745 [Solirubrobacterales bacterium]|nr:hypothetical protein [Solirubrobacterales bacterium]